ncbi:helix-turn-helix and ligand-binding sensor domain-containing protein [Flavobacterium sp. K77]|uniref:helix-turn-helix and ligand-binding sensor domain-containing protein n=1 Tax=Flavobacterium sp. K77 TaxID=2910676 RepID=UPI00272E4785|nr:triple tyrosine motif-containing protein [Flavobacterium sp. K77]
MKTPIYFLILFCYSVAFSQELPPIVKYNSATYGAGNQNWMIAQDENHFVFFANNEGLLEYNGASWELYPSPNETILRSVKVIGNKVYTGCYMEFGFWSRQANGKLKYNSLSKKIKSKILDDEQFWNILQYEHWVVFQSLNRIYIYDSKLNSFKIISPKNTISKSFWTKNGIFFQTVNQGLFEIENGKARLVSNSPILQNNKIVNLFSDADGLLIQTQLNGFYKLVGNTVTKFSTEVDAELAASSVYSSQRLSDGSFALGTVSNGIYIISSTGRFQYHITQNKGLSNNTALSLFEDDDKNLWVGLDNGINCINLQSPVQNYVDDTGTLGTVYASKLYKGILYIGTNQGLFYKKYGGNDSFKFIPGTKGQVWSLFTFDNTLFCGHDSGTFVVDKGVAQSIFSASGTWKFESVPNQKGLLLQGNYYGISVLQKTASGWRFKNKIAGFNNSSKYFEATAKNQIFISHEYKGVYRLNVDANWSKITSLYTYQSPSKGKHASLTQFNNAIYYANKQGIYKLNVATNQFAKDSLLSNVFAKDEYTSGKLIVDESNKIWLFSKNYIHYFSIGKLSSQLKQNVIPIPAFLTNSMLGYENITQISNANYLIGTTDGYYILNLNDLTFKNYKVAITSVTINKQNEANKNQEIQGKGLFKYDENNITINYTVPEYNKYINTEFQYLLTGFQEEWSEWNSKTSINFKNLPPGDYVLKVRAKYANGTLDEGVSYSFTVKKPWYLTNLALLIYFVLFVISARFIHKAYKKYYQEKELKLIEENNLLLEIKELENEQELMRVRNEQLSRDVDTKNRELAVSTMSLNSKNELLAFIKEDLKKTSEEGSKSIKSVISTINKNISEGDSWSVFKEAFDNADKDFLKKVKDAHPNLTPNDLRLCAYLRLNLSSKEVAPLLNISVRSVEIKRYRLRKKMGLSHEQGLVEYILAV